MRAVVCLRGILVLELDNPFTGLMGISGATLRSALLPLNP
jgi:hypothetical protein